MTVAAISYGQVTRASVPTAGVTVRAWAHKDQCREPRGDGDIALTESDGRYRRLIRVVGSPGQGCLTLRFYFDRGGAPDSLVRSGFIVPFRNFDASATLDSIQVDAVLPPSVSKKRSLPP